MDERECSPEQAQNHFSQVLQSLNCFHELRSYGIDPIVTYECSIFCKQSNKLMGKGNGKGLSLQSQLSAQFEALEHMLCQSGNFLKKYHTFSLVEAEQKKIPLLSSILYAEFKEKDFPQRHVPLPWAAYTLWGTQEQAYLPLIQTHPFYIFEPVADDHFDYSPLYHKTTSNGLASGCTFKEAMVHGLLEIVERHSTSLFLVETFLKKELSKIHLVDPLTLPTSLQSLVQEVEKMTQQKVLIIEMPNRFEIPAYGCMIEKKEGGGSLCEGFGASLNSSYAIERALLELMQGYHLDKKQQKHNEKIERILRDNPHLAPCVHCDVSWALQRQGHLLVHYEERTFSETTMGNYLEEIIRRLKKENFSVYYNEVYADEHVHALHVIVPEAESFCLINLGVLTPLKSHGLAALL